LANSVLANPVWAKRTELLWLSFAVGLAVAIRIAAICVWPNALTDDPDAYRAIASTLEASGVFGLMDAEGNPRPTAFRPPLYPWLLATSFRIGTDKLLSVAILHLLLAASTAALVFRLTRRLLDRFTDASAKQMLQRSAAASCLVAIDPILLRQSTLLMTETLAATLAIAVIWAWVRWCDATSPTRFAFAFGLGGLLALAFLCRPTFLVWAMFVIVSMPLVTRNRQGWASAAIAGSLVIATVFCWTLRNQRAIGHPVWATTHGGYTLLLANNESFYDHLAESEFGDVWQPEPFFNAYRNRYRGDPRTAAFWKRDWSAGTASGSRAAPAGEEDSAGEDAPGEYEDDRRCYEAAIATIKRRPGMFVWSALVRAGRLWSPLPHLTRGRSTISVSAIGGYYGLLYAAILIAAYRHRRMLLHRQWWAVWLLAVTLTGVHAVYWSNLRMRAPIMPALSVVAVFAATRPGAIAGPGSTVKPPE
jgi:4-amino-4-deoxy-L-arabinose transferase-like glycosyltransferase